jgi:hypothetical protein
MRLEFEREIAVEGEPFESVYAAVEFLAASFGPLIMLRGLEAQGVWADVRRRSRTSMIAVHPGNTWSYSDEKREVNGLLWGAHPPAHHQRRM